MIFLFYCFQNVTCYAYFVFMRIAVVRYLILHSIFFITYNCLSSVCTSVISQDSVFLTNLLCQLSAPVAQVCFVKDARCVLDVCLVPRGARVSSSECFHFLPEHARIIVMQIN